MGLAAVRSAVVAFLQPGIAGIPFLSNVFPTMPKMVRESELFTFTPAFNSTGAFMYTFFMEQSERRIALGGPHGGRKARPYVCSMMCYFLSVHKEMVDYQTDYDQFIDGLVARIESDRNAGNAPVVFQWGEGEMVGGPDLHIDHYLPTSEHDGQLLVGRCHARVTVMEIVNT